tara:strand:- start:1283 stop:1801 length:519 start_codon:yes stop_codon:yes gene_type:complete
MSTLKVSTISPLGTDATKTITLGESGGTLGIASGAKTSGFGKIGQVVQTVYSTQVTLTTSYADTGLSASITPSSTSSKVLVLVDQHVYFSTNGLSLKIVRDSTDVLTPPVNYTLHDSNSGNNRFYYPIHFLDSPSSSSSITYKTQGILHSSGTVYVQGDNNHSFMTLMEILD